MSGCYCGVKQTGASNVPLRVPNAPPSTALKSTALKLPVRLEPMPVRWSVPDEELAMASKPPASSNIARFEWQCLMPLGRPD